MEGTFHSMSQSTAFPKISAVERGSTYDPVAWRDGCSPLILVGPDGPIDQASKSIPEKRDLVRRAQAGEGILLMPWVGSYSTTVFAVDDFARALDGLASPTGRVR